MQTNATVRLLAAISAAAAAGWAQGAAAPADTAYPTKPIRLLVPQAAGGSNDIMARGVAQHLTERLGKTVVVDNRPGADGIIATEMAAKANPDGYTLIVLSSAFTSNPAMRKLPYDSLKSFEFPSMLGVAQVVLTVGPAMPVGTVKEMLAIAKAKPGQIVLASPGGFGYFMAAMFRGLSGQDFNIVLYRGGAPALIDVMGGQAHANIGSIPQSLVPIRSGKLKALATGSLKRSSFFPDLPTLAESGVPGYEAANWFSVATAAGTPPSIVNRLHAEIAGYLRMPETQKRFTGMGAEVDIRTPEEMRKLIPEEIAKWTKVAKDSNMKFE